MREVRQLLDLVEKAIAGAASRDSEEVIEAFGGPVTSRTASRAEQVAE